LQHHSQPDTKIGRQHVIQHRGVSGWTGGGESSRAGSGTGEGVGAGRAIGTGAGVGFSRNTG
jgi:hypothetical protein